MTKAMLVENIAMMNKAVKSQVVKVPVGGTFTIEKCYQTFGSGGAWSSLQTNKEGANCPEVNREEADNGFCTTVTRQLKMVSGGMVLNKSGDDIGEGRTFVNTLFIAEDVTLPKPSGFRMETGKSNGYDSHRLVPHYGKLPAEFDTGLRTFGNEWEVSLYDMKSGTKLLEFYVNYWHLNKEGTQEAWERFSRRCEALMERPIGKPFRELPTVKDVEYQDLLDQETLDEEYKEQSLYEEQLAAGQVGTKEYFEEKYSIL